MSLTYFSIWITEYSLSLACYSLSVTCHSLCDRSPGPWVTRFAAIWGSLMDPLLIIHGSVYWIGPLDMWINHSGKTTYTTDYEGFRAYLLTVTTDILRFLAGSRASPGHRSAASTVFFWLLYRSRNLIANPQVTHCNCCIFCTISVSLCTLLAPKTQWRRNRK